jgi:hypothetical protein
MSLPSSSWPSASPSSAPAQASSSPVSKASLRSRHSSSSWFAPCTGRLSWPCASSVSPSLSSHPSSSLPLRRAFGSGLDGAVGILRALRRLRARLFLSSGSSSSPSTGPSRSQFSSSASPNVSSAQPSSPPLSKARLRNGISSSPWSDLSTVPSSSPCSRSAAPV